MAQLKCSSSLNPFQASIFYFTYQATPTRRAMARLQGLDLELEKNITANSNKHRLSQQVANQSLL